MAQLTRFGYVGNYFYSGTYSAGIIILKNYGHIGFDYRQVKQTDVCTVKHYCPIEHNPCAEIALQRYWPVKVDITFNEVTKMFESVSVEILESEMGIHGDYLNQLSRTMFEDGDDTIIEITKLFSGGVLMGLE